MMAREDGQQQAAATARVISILIWIEPPESWVKTQGGGQKQMRCEHFCQIIR